jgi:chromosome segregation ATPase
MSLTDEIYRELCDGLEKGLDWQQFLAKHSTSKGPLYNAIGRLFTEVGTKITALNKERNRVQSELDQAGLTLDSLDQKIKEGENNIVSLEGRQNVLNEQAATLEAKLAEKSELAKHLAELERLGFNIERLSLLRDALREIGAKHGLKSTEATSKFFGDLKDYEAVLGAEVQLAGLQTKIETRKLEAENWQAKEEALRREYYNLKEAIEAVHTFFNKGIKLRQIIAWHQILNWFQTVEQFDQCLVQYGDIAKLLKTRKEETESYELKLAKAQGQVETLEKERAKIEGAIDALKVAGVKELKVMTGEATKQLKTLADREINEIRAVGQEVRKEFSDFFTRFDALVKKVFEIGQEFERTRQKLQKYEGVKAAIESHAAASEAENEVPEQS